MPNCGLTRVAVVDAPADACLRVTAVDGVELAPVGGDACEASHCLVLQPGEQGQALVPIGSVVAYQFADVGDREVVDCAAVCL